MTNGEVRALRVNILSAILLCCLFTVGFGLALSPFLFLPNLMGLAMIAFAIGARKLMGIVRTGALVMGLILLLIDGWFDFEGWRFLPRGPFGNQP